MRKFVVVLTIGLLIVTLGCSKTEKPIEASRVVVHYVGWNTLFRVDQSCQDLAEHGDSVVIVDSAKVAELVSGARGLRAFEVPGYGGIDARICISLYDRNNAVAGTIGISHTRLVEIDDHAYELASEFLALVVSYLPANYLES